MPGAQETAGRYMAAEIAEQPAMFDRVLTTGLPNIREIGKIVAERRPRSVLLAARGTSDNAALYAKYLIEVLLGLPAGLTSMSTSTVYHADLDYTDVLCVAVSQSGRSADLVDYTRRARSAGALTLAVTNAADSPLNAEAELSLDVLAGTEQAQPATKSYTAELLTLYLLVDAIRGGEAAGAATLPDTAAGLLDRQAEIAEWATRYRFATELMMVARGLAYPTACEATWKIMETSYLNAHAYSAADLMHGPIALLDRLSPVIALAPDGEATTTLGPVLELLHDRGADVAVIGSADLVTGPGFRLPGGVPELLSPVLEIIPCQLLAYEIAVQRGLNPDRPRALAKVTSTR